ncbi:hypothetical protein C3L33_06024, partial [Rhododendron williamsianum]
MQDQGQSTHENQPSNPNQVSTSQMQRETKDNNVQERTQQASLKIAEPCVEDEPLVNKTSHGSEHQSRDDARGQLESTSYMVQQSPEAANEPVGPARGLVPQNVEDACGPKVPTPGLIHQPGEDAYEPVETAHGLAENTTQPTHDLVHQVADVDSFADASQRDMDFIYVEKEFDPESKQHVKLFPLDGLYLNSQDKGYGDSTPMSSSVQQSPAFNRPENYLKAKGSPSIVSPTSTRSCDLAQIENGPVKLSSGDARSGFHPDTENRPHKKLRVAPNKQSLPAEMNAQMVNSQGDSHIPLNGQIPQVQGNSTTTHSWPPQNFRQQSFVSKNQSLLQAQMAQFPMQSAGHLTFIISSRQQSSLQNLGSSHSRVESGQQFAYQVMSPHSASASEFPNPQQQSRGITQPRHAAASGSSVSPHNQLQPSHGVTPHGAAASGSAVSPHNQLQPSHGVTPHGAGASRPSSSSYNQQHHRK